MHTLGPTAPPLADRAERPIPRHRTAAGLGTEVVKLNQERFMQAAWEQVGDVLTANALLDRARFIQQVADRIHRAMSPRSASQALLSLTAPVHERVVADDRPLDRGPRT